MLGGSQKLIVSDSALRKGASFHNTDHILWFLSHVMSCIISPEEGQHCGELLGVQQLVADALVHGGLAARHPALHQAGRHHRYNISVDMVTSKSLNFGPHIFKYPHSVKNSLPDSSRISSNLNMYYFTERGFASRSFMLIHGDDWLRYYITLYVLVLHYMFYRKGKPDMKRNSRSKL